MLLIYHMPFTITANIGSKNPKASFTTNSRKKIKKLCKALKNSPKLGVTFGTILTGLTGFVTVSNHNPTYKKQEENFKSFAKNVYDTYITNKNNDLYDFFNKGLEYLEDPAESNSVKKSILKNTKNNIIQMGEQDKNKKLMEEWVLFINLALQKDKDKTVDEKIIEENISKLTLNNLDDIYNIHIDTLKTDIPDKYKEILFVLYKCFFYINVNDDSVKKKISNIIKQCQKNISNYNKVSTKDKDQQTSTVKIDPSYVKKNTDIKSILESIVKKHPKGLNAWEQRVQQRKLEREKNEYDDTYSVTKPDNHIDSFGEIINDHNKSVIQSISIQNPKVLNTEELQDNNAYSITKPANIIINDSTTGIDKLDSLLNNLHDILKQDKIDFKNFQTVQKHIAGIKQYMDNEKHNKDDDYFSQFIDKQLPYDKITNEYKISIKNKIDQYYKMLEEIMKSINDKGEQEQQFAQIKTKLQNELYDLNQEFVKFKNHMIKFNQDNDTKFKNLTEQISQLESKVPNENHNSEINNINNEINDLKDQMSRLKSRESHENNSKEIEILNNKLNKLIDQIFQLESNSPNENHNSEINSEINDIKNTLNNLIDQISQLKSRESNENYSNEINTLRIKFSQLENKVPNKNNSKKIQILNNEINDLKDQMSQLDSRELNENYSNEIEILNNKLNKLIDQMSQLKNNSPNENHNSEINDIKNTLQNLKEQLKNNKPGTQFNQEEIKKMIEDQIKNNPSTSSINKMKTTAHREIGEKVVKKLMDIICKKHYSSTNNFKQDIVFGKDKTVLSRTVQSQNDGKLRTLNNMLNAEQVIDKNKNHTIFTTTDIGDNKMQSLVKLIQSDIMKHFRERTLMADSHGEGNRVSLVVTENGIGKNVTTMITNLLPKMDGDKYVDTLNVNINNIGEIINEATNEYYGDNNQYQDYFVVSEWDNDQLENDKTFKERKDVSKDFAKIMIHVIRGFDKCIRETIATNYGDEFKQITNLENNNRTVAQICEEIKVHLIFDEARALTQAALLMNSGEYKKQVLRNSLVSFLSNWSNGHLSSASMENILQKTKYMEYGSRITLVFSGWGKNSKKDPKKKKKKKNKEEEEEVLSKERNGKLIFCNKNFTNLTNTSTSFLSDIMIMLLYMSQQEKNTKDLMGSFINTCFKNKDKKRTAKNIDITTLTNNKLIKDYITKKQSKSTPLRKFMKDIASGNMTKAEIPDAVLVAVGQCILYLNDSKYPSFKNTRNDVVSSAIMSYIMYDPTSLEGTIENRKSSSVKRIKELMNVIDLMGFKLGTLKYNKGDKPVENHKKIVNHFINQYVKKYVKSFHDKELSGVPESKHIIIESKK